MATSSDPFQSCQECGATIYPEHIEAHAADNWHGKLLCPHCLQEKRREGQVGVATLAADLSDLTEQPNPPLSLADDDGLSDRPAAGAARGRSIRAFGAGGAISMSQASGEQVQLQRPTRLGVPYATRCRTFHCKLNEASISYMDRQINEWVDAHADVEIKFASTTVGVFEGKHSDPNLIVTVFY